MWMLISALAALAFVPVAISCGGSGSETDTTPNSSGMSGMPGHGGTMAATEQPFDATFIDSMVEHHGGAIEMANEALAQATRPEILGLARAIIVSQGEEIEQLQAWRDEWYPSLPPTGGMGMSMGEMQLSSDNNTPFELRFIDAMIPHHESAIDMANMALSESEREEIRAMAEDIVRVQSDEIAQMKEWRADWFGE